MLPRPPYLIRENAESGHTYVLQMDLSGRMGWDRGQMGVAEQICVGKT